MLEQALPHMVVRSVLRGPFRLCHLDLNYRSILFDQAYHITRVLDWTGADCSMGAHFRRSPEFMTFAGLSEEGKSPIQDFDVRSARTSRC